MNQNKLRNSAVAGLTLITSAVTGCKTPEQIGYERTFVRLDDEQKLEVWAEYPYGINRRGINQVQIYGKNGELLYTDNLDDLVFSPNGIGPDGNLTMTREEYLDKKITIVVSDNKGNSFKKS